MKPAYTLVITGLLVLFLLACGCTQEPKPAEVTPAPVVSLATSPSPAVMPVANPYPDAKPLNAPAVFGTGDMTGTATVTKYVIKPNYNWTSPAWRSAREQAAYAPPLGVQTGYNTESPATGSTFLFIFFKVENTGTKAIYAPSPQQIVVFVDGRTYSYHPVSDAEVNIDGIAGTQYDYRIGKGGTGGYVQPGASNAAEGYLIYEVPEGMTPANAFVVANLDHQTRAEWALG
jgi:hypothetical protein